MNIVCIIQARTTSSRLPNKVLLSLPYGSNKTVLEQVIVRVKESKLINKVVVATTINKTDDGIEKLCQNLGIICSRGSENNVLSRYYEAAKANNADIVVRITSDCPCIDADIIDELLKFHLSNKNDFSSNNQIHSYPHGLDVEVVNFKVLEEAYYNATESYEKEHVMPYIYKSHPEKYKIGTLKDKVNNHKIRVTLDTEEDYILLCLVYDYMHQLKKINFKKIDIIKLFNEKPYLYKINNKIIQKKVCKNFQEELQEGIEVLRKQDLNRLVNFLESKIL